MSSKIEPQSVKIAKTRGVRAVWERWRAALKGGDLLFARQANAFCLTIFCLLAVWFSFAWHSYQVEHTSKELAETSRNWVRQFGYLEGLTRQVSLAGLEAMVDKDLPRSRASAEQYQAKISETLNSIKESVAQQPGAFSGEVISDISNLQRRLGELGQSVELLFIISAKNDSVATLRGFRDTDKIANNFLANLQSVQQKLNTRFEQLLLEVTTEPWWLVAARILGGVLALIAIGWAFATTLVMADRAAKRVDIQRRLKDKLEGQINSYEERFVTSQASIEQLRREVSEWTKTFQSDPLPMFQIDTSGQMVIFNDAWLKLTGLSRSEISAGEWQKVLPLHVAGQVFELVKNPSSYSGVHSLISVVRPVKKGTRSIPVRIHLRARESGGSLVSEGRITDLSELYTWKRKVEDQGEELNLLVKLSSCGVWSLDLSNQHLFWDYPFNNFPSDSPSGWVEILSLDDTQRIKSKIRESLVQQEIWQVEVKAKDKDGIERSIILQGLTHFNEDGFPAVARGIARYTDQVGRSEPEKFIPDLPKGLSVLMRQSSNLSSAEVDQLTGRGHQVVVARTVDEFVYEAESRDFDLILLNESIEVDPATLERLMKLKGLDGGNKVPLIVRLMGLDDLNYQKHLPTVSATEGLNTSQEGNPPQPDQGMSKAAVDINQFTPLASAADDFTQNSTSAWEEWPNYDEISGLGVEPIVGINDTASIAADAGELGSEATSSNISVDQALGLDKQEQGAASQPSGNMSGHPFDQQEPNLPGEEQTTSQKQQRNPTIFGDLRDHYE